MKLLRHIYEGRRISDKHRQNGNDPLEHTHLNRQLLMNAITQGYTSITCIYKAVEVVSAQGWYWQTRRGREGHRTLLPQIYPRAIR